MSSPADDLPRLLASASDLAHRMVRATGEARDALLHQLEDIVDEIERAGMTRSP